jgi:hypothetical protein
MPRPEQLSPKDIVSDQWFALNTFVVWISIYYE